MKNAAPDGRRRLDCSRFCRRRRAAAHVGLNRKRHTTAGRSAGLRRQPVRFCKLRIFTRGTCARSYCLHQWRAKSPMQDTHRGRRCALRIRSSRLTMLAARHDMDTNCSARSGALRQNTVSPRVPLAAFKGRFLNLRNLYKAPATE
jgi:hypothetical protein